MRALRGAARREGVSRRPHHAARVRRPGSGGRPARPDQPRGIGGRQRRRRRRLRLQLKHAALLLILLPALARAEDSVDVSVSYFTEPVKVQELHVIRPAVDLNVDANRALSFKFGYDADIVSGAT